MRFYTALLSVFLSAAACAQTPVVPDPEVSKARVEIEKLRELVRLGAAPRLQLEKAEAAMSDAEDAAFLRKTLYGQDLTEEQTDEMLAVVNRRVARRQKAYDDAQALVAVGAAAATTLEKPKADLGTARREADLAESRARLVRDLAQMARLEEEFIAKLNYSPVEARALADRFDGDGIFTMADFARVNAAFQNEFGKPLPVSAMGATAVHRALGFDHRNRVDVAVRPDTPEGVWLLGYLVKQRIPYFAFKQAVPGKATGAHIHLGPVSTHLATGG